MMYVLLIEQTGTARMYIEATDADDARAKATTLLDAQQAKTLLDTTGWDAEKIVDVVEIPAVDADEDNARDNATALKEIDL